MSSLLYLSYYLRNLEAAFWTPAAAFWNLAAVLLETMLIGNALG
jgi:hypothetical protein